MRVDAFAIDATQVTNEQFARVRRGDRLPHRRRASAGPGRLPGRARRRTWCPDRWCSPRPRARSTCVTSASGGPGRPGACWSSPRGPRQLGEAAAGPPGRARRLRGRARVRDVGRARACRPRPSGSTPPAAAWTGATYTWGDEARPGRADHGEHLGRARTSPGAARGRAGSSRTAPGRQLPRQRLRPVRHGRQRLGVDRRTGGPSDTPTRSTSRAASRRTRAAGTWRRATTRRSRSSGSDAG